MATLVKTTIELPDVLGEARKIAARDGITVKAPVKQGCGA
jgi:hypothetical protein